MKLCKSHWEDAICTAIYLINRMPSSVLDFKPPIELLMGTTTIQPISPKVFGCICFVHDRGKSRGKLDSKSLKCVFIINQLRRISTNVITPQQGIFISMDVIFKTMSRSSVIISHLFRVEALRKSEIPYHNH